MGLTFALAGTIVLAISAFSVANPVFLNRLQERQLDCPASCIMTVTTTVTSSASCISAPLYSTATESLDSSAMSSISSATFPTLVISSSTSAGAATTNRSTIAASSPETAPSPACRRNNCLRHFIRHPAATPFCETYTQTLRNETVGLPDLVSQCHYEPSRISSACSCLLTRTSSLQITSTPGNGTSTSSEATITSDLGASSSTSTLSNATSSPATSTSDLQATSSTATFSTVISSSATITSNPVVNGGVITAIDPCHHNNCLRQFLQSPTVLGFCATYTTSVNTQTTALPDYVSMCHDDPVRISSACSCVGGLVATETEAAAASTSTSSCTSSVVFETRMMTTTILVTGTSSSSDFSVSSSNLTLTFTSETSLSSISEASLASTLTSTPAP